MKRGRLILGLTLLVAINAAPMFADDVAQRLESIVIDTFDDPNQRVWLENGKEHKEERVWMVKGSKFATKDFPAQAYVAAWPAALFDTNPDNLPLKSLGIHGKFDRKGYNYIEMIPSKKDSSGNLVSSPMPLPGIAKSLDFWVWGSYYKYYMEIHVRDARGIPYVLDAGSIFFQGWKNITVKIPANIPQTRIYLPKTTGLVVTEIVLRTDPLENVDDFYVYVDQLKVLTDMHDNPYDGRELTRPDFLDKYWSKNSQSASTTTTTTPTTTTGQ